MTQSCVLLDLGLVDYREAWEFQKYLVGERLKDAVPDTLVIVEHPPVYTMGRRGTTTGLSESGLPVHEVERGGDVTYHGPGQLVGYPILALSRGKLDVKQHVTRLEELLTQTVAKHGIKGERGPHAGLWVGPKKLASIGIAVKHYVTYHGFALNVNLDLTPFRSIQPCGIDGSLITSMEELLGHEVSMEEVKLSLVQSASKSFQAALLLSGSMADLKDTLRELAESKATPGDGQGSLQSLS